MGLVVWSALGDPWSTEEIADNFVKLDLHDHTSGKGKRITTAAIEDGAVTLEKLDSGALPDLTIPDNAITNVKLADDAVTAAEIQDGSVGTNELAPGAVNSSKLANNSVVRASTSKAFVQAKRITYSAESNKTITWDTAFADTNYSVAFGIEGLGWGNNVPRITSKATTTVTISTPSVVSGTLNVIGIHD